MSYKIFIDGASRGNPGLSGAGFLIINVKENWPIAISTFPLGQLTNNKAEYEALIKALERMGKIGLLSSEIEIYTDCQLIWGHLTQGWSIDPNMQPYVDRAKDLLQNFKVKIIKVKRKKMHVADILANLGCDMNG